MAVSQNGWPGIVSGTDARLVPLSWITGRVLRGDVHTVFDYLCRRFHAEVEPIRKDWSWGHYYRAIRGAKALSNHASATSVDLNAPEHPLGKRNTFDARQQAAIHRILDALDGVVRWGGDYSGRPDDMHFEINASPARVAAVARRLGASPVGSAVGGAASRPGQHLPTLTFPSLPEDDMTPDQARKLDAIHAALFDGGTSMPEGLPLKDLIDQRTRDLPGRTRDAVWSAEVGTGKDRRTMSEALVGIPLRVWSWVVPRGGRGVVAIQELADAKTAGMSAAATLAGLEAAVSAITAASDVDPALIREAVRAGVSDALTSIETTVTIKEQS